MSAIPGAPGWSFYGRGVELGALLEHMRTPRWFFGTIHGRRRIGKTALIQQAIATLEADGSKGGPWLLAEVPDSVPADFASVFRSAVGAAGLESRAGDPTWADSLPAVADAVESLCRSGVTVVFDEFQVCRRGPLSGFPSLLKARIDLLRDRTAVGGLVLLGSVQTEMEALLDDRHAPLYGRKTFDISLGPWSLSTMMAVAARHGAANPRKLLTLATLFGGVPKYWRDYGESSGLAEIPGWRDWAGRVCQRFFLRVDSPLRDDGETLLGRELRRNYLAVLRAVARHGPCPHAELQDALPGVSLGPYLKTLVRDLRLVERRSPVFATGNQRRARYSVADPFLLAWLRVFHPARQAARFLPAARVADGIMDRLATLEGHSFERMVADATEEASRTGRGFAVTDRVRGYWNRPRRSEASVELDLVAWNQDDKVVRFGSCKRRAAKHGKRSLDGFRAHVERFVTSTGRRFAGWKRQLVLFSPVFTKEERARLEADGWMCRDLEDIRRSLVDGNSGARGEAVASPKVAGAD